MVFMISSLRSVGVGFYFILKKFRLSLGGRTAKFKNSNLSHSTNYRVP
jgi:hypothetical protein